jgi:hypothetical protein
MKVMKVMKVMDVRGEEACGMQSAASESTVATTHPIPGSNQ